MPRVTRICVNSQQHVAHQLSSNELALLTSATEDPRRLGLCKTSHYRVELPRVFHGVRSVRLVDYKIPFRTRLKAVVQDTPAAHAPLGVIYQTDDPSDMSPTLQEAQFAAVGASEGVTLTARSQLPSDYTVYVQPTRGTMQDGALVNFYFSDASDTLAFGTAAFSIDPVDLTLHVEELADGDGTFALRRRPRPIQDATRYTSGELGRGTPDVTPSSQDTIYVCRQDHVGVTYTTGNFATYWSVLAGSLPVSPSDRALAVFTTRTASTALQYISPSTTGQVYGVTYDAKDHKSLSQLTIRLTEDDDFAYFPPLEVESTESGTITSTYTFMEHTLVLEIVEEA